MNKIIYVVLAVLDTLLMGVVGFIAFTILIGSGLPFLLFLFIAGLLNAVLAWYIAVMASRPISVTIKIVFVLSFIAGLIPIIYMFLFAMSVAKNGGII